MKTTTIPVVMGALGLIKNGTSHIVRNTLHQIDFYLILTLGPRNGLLCCIIRKRVIIIIMIIHFI